jgi:hypothetical protein
MERMSEAALLDAERKVERRLRAVPAAINADPVLVRRASLLDADILVGIGGAGFILPVRAGQLGAIEPATRLMRPWTFAIRADAATWLEHWRDPPRPGWHDILALAKSGKLTIEGNLIPFMQHLQFIKDMLAAPRHIR